MEMFDNRRRALCNSSTAICLCYFVPRQDGRGPERSLANVVIDWGLLTCNLGCHLALLGTPFLPADVWTTCCAGIDLDVENVRTWCPE